MQRSQLLLRCNEFLALANQGLHANGHSLLRHWWLRASSECHEHANHGPHPSDLPLQQNQLLVMYSEYHAHVGIESSQDCQRNMHLLHLRECRFVLVRVRLPPRTNDPIRLLHPGSSLPRVRQGSRTWRFYHLSCCERSEERRVGKDC